MPYASPFVISSAVVYTDKKLSACFFLENISWLAPGTGKKDHKPLMPVRLLKIAHRFLLSCLVMTVVAFGVALLFPFEVALKRVGLVADHSGFTFWWNQETARYLHEHGGYWLPWYYWLGYPTIGSLEGSWYLNCPWIFCMLSFGILIILVKVRTRRVPIGFPIMPQAPLEAPREGDGEKMAEESK